MAKGFAKMAQNIQRVRSPSRAVESNAYNVRAVDHRMTGQQRPYSVAQHHARNAPAVTRKQTLRDVQKAQTRQRLLDAARIVFYSAGYYGATVDQVVAEAGASRPTFYLHFRDKEEVLEELMRIYMARAVPTMEQLPGPHPTVDELKDWLREVGKFLTEERALFSLVHQVSAHKQSNRVNYGLETTDAWITALGRRAPAFAAAVKGKGQDLNARAWAELLVIDIVWAGANVARDKVAAFTDETVMIVAKSLHDFINDPRFHAKPAKAKREGAIRRLATRRRRPAAEGAK